MILQVKLEPEHRVGILIDQESPDSMPEHPKSIFDHFEIITIIGKC